MTLGFNKDSVGMKTMKDWEMKKVEEGFRKEKEKSYEIRCPPICKSKSRCVE